jgi:Ca2+-binding RTX toxin-like protein
MALVIGKAGPYEWYQTTIDYNDGVTDGADQIVGTDKIDHIYAGGGNDIIKGGGGADVINGGEGHDGVTYEDSDVGVQVSLVTGTGKGGTAEGDTLISIEDVYGSKFDDQLVGNSGDNLLSGGDGNDTLKGGGGTDVLKGGDGDDTMYVDGAEDHVYGGQGNDTLVMSSKQGMVINLNTGFIDNNPYTSPGDYFHAPHFNWHGPFSPLDAYWHAQGDTQQVTDVENVVGSNYADKIVGNDVANSLSGNGGDDVLFGMGGNDTLSGGTGKDFLIGGAGADTLTGGQDADVFIWNAVNESVFTGGKPQDIVTDFQPGQDMLDLSALNISLADFLQVDNQNVGGQNYTFVGIDANHNGQFDEGEFAIAVKMAAGTTLHASDFYF